jgi:hypothetical protein
MESNEPDAWFQNLRRIVVRENFRGMLHLACCSILLRSS